MVEVGMEKQRRYDEGVQKIQQSIYNVAGLEVGNDASKAYLQSQLNDLGSKLKSVAGGDFSNYQLVNSVSGMASQLIKDPFIKAGAQSAAKIQKELAVMEASRKAGKSDINNEQYFQEKFLKPYLSAGLKDANGKPIVFSGQYSEHVDIMAKIRENIKAAGADESILQQMYLTDENGKFKIDPITKLPIPARTMTEVTSSSNERQVKSIIDAVLKEGNVKNQLMIDGWANTKDVPTENILGVFAKQYESKFSNVDADISEINTLLTGKLSAEKRLELEEEKKELITERKGYETQFLDLKEQSLNSPELFKQNYYRISYENTLLNSFVDTKRNVKNVDNPLTKQLNWEQNFAAEEKQRSFTRGIQSAQLRIDEAKFQADYEYDQTTGQWKKKPEPGAVDASGLVRTTATVGGKEDTTASQRNYSQIEAIGQTNYVQGLDLMYKFLSQSNDGKNKNGQPLTKEDVKRTIDVWAKNSGETPQNFITRWVLNLNNKAKENGVVLSNSDRERMAEFKRNHNNYTTLISIDKYADQEVLKQTGVNVNDYTKELNPINVKLSNGKSTTITKQDILDYMLIVKNDDKVAENRLVSKYGSIDNFPLNTARGKRLNPDELDRRVKLQQQSGMFSIYSKDFDSFKKAGELKNQLLSKYIGTEDVFSFSDTEEKAMKAAKNRISGFISNANNLSGTNYEQQAALKALNESRSNVSFRASAPYMEGGAWKGTVTITSEDGKVIEVDIPVQSDFEQLTQKKFNPYRINPLEARAAVSPYESTNLGAYTTDPNAWQTAAIGSSDFVSLQNSPNYIALGADLNNVAGGKTVTVYIKDKRTGKVIKPIEFNRVYVSEDQARSDLGTLNDAMISSQLK
jgi:hypothetical protein